MSNPMKLVQLRSWVEENEKEQLVVVVAQATWYLAVPVEQQHTTLFAGAPPKPEAHLLEPLETNECRTTLYGSQRHPGLVRAALDSCLSTVAHTAAKTAAWEDASEDSEGGSKVPTTDDQKAP